MKNTNQTSLSNLQNDFSLTTMNMIMMGEKQTENTGL